MWEALGDVSTYVEPFAGSLAVLLGRPHWPWAGRRAETVNDLDGMIANLWRSLSFDPEAVVCAADWPIVQVDMRARWDDLEKRRASMVENLRADPRWFDAEAAGWWVWGQSAAVGGQWIAGALGRPQSIGTGKGMGIHATDGINRLRACGERLRSVSVWCHDWTALVTPACVGVGMASGIFLDPPYGDSRSVGIYRHDSTTLFADVTEWATTADPALRIVIAGFEGEHNTLDERGWSRRAWVPAEAGMHTHGSDDSRGNANRSREVLWCSPSCLAAKQESLFRRAS